MVNYSTQAILYRTKISFIKMFARTWTEYLILISSVIHRSLNKSVVHLLTVLNSVVHTLPYYATENQKFYIAELLQTIVPPDIVSVLLSIESCLAARVISCAVLLLLSSELNVFFSLIKLFLFLKQANSTLFGRVYMMGSVTQFMYKASWLAKNTVWFMFMDRERKVRIT